MTEPLEFPRCTRCGGAIVLLAGEQAREVCWCCERQIPMPIHSPQVKGAER